jgi:DNA repair exonuclease SbcCD ATPase subunit
VTPRDKAAMDVAVELSGRSQAEWLRDAIDEKIEKDIPEYGTWKTASQTVRRIRMFEFIAAFGLIKTKKIAKDLTNMLALTDKDVAGKADLAVKEKNLDAAGLLLTQLRTAHNHEIQEFERLDTLYHQYLAAAEQLKNRLDDPALPAGDRGQVEAGLNDLVGKLEKISPDLEQHRHDVDESAALLSEATDAYEQKAADLKTAKQQLEEAQRDLTRAQIANDRSKEHAEQAAKVAGLRSDAQASGLDTALNAMQQEAAKLRANAEANQLKAQTLARGPAPVEDNPFVKEALAAAQGAKPNSSVLDRLAALKK